MFLRLILLKSLAGCVLLLILQDMPIKRNGSLSHQKRVKKMVGT